MPRRCAEFSLAPGWTSQSREIVLDIAAMLVDLRGKARHLDYHWDGRRVDYYRDAGSRQVFAIGA